MYGDENSWLRNECNKRLHGNCFERPDIDCSNQNFNKCGVNDDEKGTIHKGNREHASLTKINSDKTERINFATDKTVASTTISKPPEAECIPLKLESSDAIPPSMDIIVRDLSKTLRKDLDARIKKIMYEALDKWWTREEQRQIIQKTNTCNDVVRPQKYDVLVLLNNYGDYLNSRLTSENERERLREKLSFNMLEPNIDSVQSRRHSPFQLINDEFADFFETRLSSIHGLGLFAQRSFRHNDFVIEYRGEVITENEGNLRELMYKRQGLRNFYLFGLENKQIIDATVRGNLGRFINHSCNVSELTSFTLFNSSLAFIVLFLYSRTVFHTHHYAVQKWTFMLSGQYLLMKKSPSIIDCQRKTRKFDVTARH